MLNIQNKSNEPIIKMLFFSFSCSFDVIDLDVNLTVTDSIICGDERTVKRKKKKKRFLKC